MYGLSVWTKWGGTKCKKMGEDGRSAKHNLPAVSTTQSLQAGWPEYSPAMNEVNGNFAKDAKINKLKEVDCGTKSYI